MNFLEFKIKSYIKDIIKELYDYEIIDLSIEFPPKKELGDFCFRTFSLSKVLKKKPIQIGQEIIDFVNVNFDKYGFFHDLKLEGPYLNFKIDPSTYSKIFIENLKSFNFVKSELYKNQTIYIDYIGTNIGKPLHIGHMCTPNQGQVIVNVYRKLGYNVIGDSHIGDWGIIFGKLITAFKLWGDEEKLKINAVDYLLDLYVKITEEIKNNQNLEQQTRDEFKLLSQGNNTSIDLWKKFTSYSINAMQVQLDKLHIKPDYNIGESFYEGIGLPKMGDYPDLKNDMTSIVDELIKLGIASENDDGSVGVVFQDELKIPSCILRKRDGTHGYLASDLSAIKYRMQNWNPKKILYFVDVRQQLHLKQAFTISKLAGWIGNTELFHAYNGFISLKDGAMSTRLGRIIKLEDLLIESENRAKNIILEKRQDLGDSELKKLSKIIGIGAIKYGYLSKNRTTDVIFDWDEFMTFEGNSGPYIQYAYVRSIQILKNFTPDFYNNIISGSFINQEEFDLVKDLFSYQNILDETAKNCSPHILANYCYSLTKKFNTFYNKVHILNEENDNRKKLLLSLVSAFSKTLKDGFNLLGIEMPERM